MTKLKTIREYMDLVPTCQFCGSPMQTKLIGKKKPNHIPSYRMTFEETSFFNDFQRTLLNPHRKPGSLSTEDNPIWYPSNQIGDELNFYYAIKEDRRLIFSVNIDTSKITGDVDRVQRVIWDHQLTIARNCETCTQGYLCESSPIYLGRKSKTIFPFWLFMEGFVVDLQDKNYILLSAHGTQLKTTALYTKSSNEIIKKLPLIELHSIRGKDNILNKIKTILVFS